MTNFEKAFEEVIGHEGGYVNHPSDPGGETKFGISKRAYPGEDIKNLTLDRAKVLYKRDYWDQVRGDLLPWPLSLFVFDYAVNSGVRQASKALQSLLGVEPDGAIGQQTLAALAAVKSVPELSSRYLSNRIVFLSGLATWMHFKNGWAMRIVQLARHLG